MAWPSMTAADVLAGEGAKTRGADFISRDDIVAASAWTWAANHSGFTTSLADVSTAYFTLPSWSASTAVITATFTAERDPAVSGNCNFRIRGRKDGAAWVDGVTLNTAITTVIAPYECTLTIGAALGWESSVVEFVFQAQAPTGLTSQWQAGMAHVIGNMRVVPV